MEILKDFQICISVPLIKSCTRKIKRNCQKKQKNKNKNQLPPEFYITSQKRKSSVTQTIKLQH